MKKRFFLLLAGIAGFCTVQAQQDFGVYIGKNTATFVNENNENPTILEYPELVSVLGYQLGVNYTLDIKHHLNLELEVGLQYIEADNKGIIYVQDETNPNEIDQVGGALNPTTMEYTSITVSPLFQFWFNDHFSVLAGPKIETILSGKSSFYHFYHKYKPFKQYNVSLTLGAAAELSNRLSFHVRNSIGAWEVTQKQDDSFYELRHLTEFGLAYKFNM